MTDGPIFDLDVEALGISAHIIAEIDAMIVRLGQAGTAPPETVVRVWRVIDRDPRTLDPLQLLGAFVVLLHTLAALERAGGES